MIAADSISALDTDNLNDVLEFVAALCEADMATIRFGAEDGGVLARVGFGDISPSNSDLFLEAVKRQNDLLIVPDVSADPILCKHPHVANRAGIRFFAAAPIRNHASGLVGAICVFGKTSRPHGLSMTQQRGLLQLAEAIRGRLLRTFTQQLLDEGNRFYQVVAELMPDMVWTSEPSGELDYFNPNWFEFTGAGPREPYERRWARYIYSEDRAEVERSWLQCLA
ncbi:MAG: GAF domain-containing protein, partial [Beijerinckiaceae bacterium]|nr:GAF domain-containing protein [Beijerinckiaceae bacterium]